MISYRVLLTKVESNHSNLRTNEVEGQVLELPQVGKNLSLIGESLTEGMSHRWINTTEIKEVEMNTDETEFTFKTQNSTYKLKVLGTEDIK